MSKGFGVDVYGVPFYGPETTPSANVTPSVAPFTATQADYGEIILQWAAPQNTPWKYMQLVRSVYGYPSTAQDGILLAQFTAGTMQKTYDDTGLTPGVIYYYTMFVTLEAPTWSSSVTYPLNYQVLFNGQYWTSLNASNTNHSPTGGSAFWASGPYVPTWLPAGYAGTLALANDGYGSLLYNRAPQPYKTNTADVMSNTAVDNQSLQNYLNVMGWGLDQIKNRYDSLLNVNNPDVVSATSLDILGQQLGINTDYMTTPQQRRQRIKNATVNYQMKGENQSIHNIIAQLTGWDSTITEAANLYNSADQATALHPQFDAWNANTTYFTNQYVSYNGYTYQASQQNVNHAPSGGATNNTWWNVQQNIVNTATLFNPATGSTSTWGYGPPVTPAAIGGVLTGIASPLSSSVHNWNAFIASDLNVGTDITSSAPLLTPNWSNSTNYSITANVLYTDGYYYTALQASGPGTPHGAITPGTNNSFWKPFYYTTSDLPNTVKDGAALATLPTWNSTTTYTVGTQVQFNGIIYQATLTSLNKQPSGFYYSNTSWIAIGPYVRQIMTSGYFAQVLTAGITTTVRCAPIYYDINGRQIKNSSSSRTLPYYVDIGYTARFQTDFAQLTQTTEASIANATSSGVVLSPLWVDAPSGAWYSSYGMAAVNQSVAGTNTWTNLEISNGNAFGRYALTLVTDYTDTVHYSHGLLFAWSAGNSFWYTTRVGLWKVVAGVETKMLTWSRLNNGDRIVVDWFSSGQVDVFVYARDGKGTLNLLGSVAAANGPTGGTIAGVMQKYSATGAL